AVRLERRSDRAGLRAAPGAGLLQHAQDLDLRRLERDPARHPGEDGAGALMDLKLSAEDRAFRDEVRAFLAAELPAEIRRKVETNLPVSKAEQTRWQKILHAKGWIAPGWPREHGGTGWTPMQRYIFDDELGAAGAPPLNPFGVGMVGPVLYTFG